MPATLPPGDVLGADLHQCGGVLLPGINREAGDVDTRDVGDADRNCAIDGREGSDAQAESAVSGRLTSMLRSTE